MEWIVDRIEGNIAVLEYELAKTVDIPVEALPDGVKEGDVIKLSKDESETKKRKNKIKEKTNKLFV